MRTACERPRAQPYLAARLLVGLAIVGAGCSSTSPGFGGNGDDGGQSFDLSVPRVGVDAAAPSTDLAMPTTSTDLAMPVAGGNTITGMVVGNTFDAVSTALWIGSPDDPATTVVYLFSKPVKCSELQTMGWDRRVTNATNDLELKMFGTMPMDFTVTTSLTPAPGEASVNYTLTAQRGIPAEQHAMTGTVTLSTINPATNVTGSFNLDFGGGDTLMGTYDAVYCPGGHEP